MTHQWGDKRGHIVVLGAQPEWLSGLRGPMIRDFLGRGYRVTAIGAEEMPAVRRTLEDWGASYVVVPIRRAGLNPVADAGAIFSLWHTLRRLQPEIVFAYTVKPVVYGMPVAWAAGVKRRFAMITGRGYSFQPGNEMSRRVARMLATLLYRVGLRFAHGVLFHNEDDRALFRHARMITGNTRTARIWGSGIDLDQHRPQPLPDGPITFLMIGRLIRDKGVREYAAAARKIVAEGAAARFVLVGPMDPSPNGVTDAELAEWQASGAIDYRGPLDDVRPAIGACHVLVLPSYAEGLPRTVLEGMAAGRAVITTEAPGCADTVVEGVTGYKVPVRDASTLAEAMRRCIGDPDFVVRAGEAGLRFAMDRFDVNAVNADIARFIGIADTECDSDQIIV